MPMHLHLVFVSIKMVDGISDTIERFHLWHSEFCCKREVEHLGCERLFSLLYQGVHGVRSASSYNFLHTTELLLEALEPLLP